MNKRIIPVQIRNEQIIGAGVVVGAAGSGNDVILQLHFGPAWDGLVKYATFRNALGEDPTVVLLTTDMMVEWSEREPGAEEAAPEEGICPVVCSCASVYNVPIPFQAKAEEGKMMVTLQGYKLNEDGSQVEAATMTATAYFRVLASGYSMPEDGNLTPELAMQLQAEIQSIIAGLESPTFKKLTVKDLTGQTRYHYSMDEYGITLYEPGGMPLVRIVRDGSGVEVYDGEIVEEQDPDDPSVVHRYLKAASKLRSTGVSTSSRAGGIEITNGDAESGRPPMLLFRDKTQAVLAQIYSDEDGRLWIRADKISATGGKGLPAVEDPADLTTKKYVDDGDAAAIKRAETAEVHASQAKRAADNSAAAADAARDAAQAIADHPNKAQDGTWWVWDSAAGEYRDTGDSAVGPRGEQGEAGAPGPKGDPADPPLIGPASMISELKPGQRLLITSCEKPDEDWSGVTDPMTEIAKLRKEIAAMKAGVIEMNVKTTDWMGSSAPYYARINNTALGERHGIVGISETATQAEREAAAEAQIYLSRLNDGTRVLEASWIKPEMDLPLTILMV